MKVEVIKAKDRFAEDTKVKAEDRIRVAAYCRVSTDDEEQIKSYDSMVMHYTDMIQNNPKWIFAGIYADKAITGTKTQKRENFQRMIQDCLDGNIDMIIAKSIPRFARNTLDTLKYVRLLKERGIAIYFEVEKINTLKDGEFLMTILSSVAQQEVENTSAYVKKGLKMKMQRGEMVGFNGCMGYDYDTEEKCLYINEDEAETVRYIFDRYSDGAGCTIIARELNERKIQTKKGGLWTISTVLGIIKNEKYVGDLRMGKTYTVDPITKRRLPNKGEEDQFYIRDHHEAIISREVYEKVQAIRNKRNGTQNTDSPGERTKFSRQYAFSSMIRCGFCESSFSRRCWHSGTSHEKITWQCVKSTKNGKYNCPDSKGVPEKVIEKAFVESYRMICKNDAGAINEFIKRIEKTLTPEATAAKIAKIKKESRNIHDKRKKLVEKYLEGTIPEDIYNIKDNEFSEQISNFDNELETLVEREKTETETKNRIERFKKVLLSNSTLEEFDRDVFESIVEKVIIGGYDEDGNKDPYKITFIYKTGFTDEIGDTKDRFDVRKPRQKKSEGTHLACTNELGQGEKPCANEVDDTCGNRLFTFEKSPSLSHFRGILGRNKTVVLAKKYVNGHTCRTGYKLFNTFIFWNGLLKL